MVHRDSLATENQNPVSMQLVNFTGPWVIIDSTASLNEPSSFTSLNSPKRIRGIIYVGWRGCRLVSDPINRPKKNIEQGRSHLPTCLQNPQRFWQCKPQKRAKIKTSFRTWSLLLSNLAKAQPIYSSNQKSYFSNRKTLSFYHFLGFK